MEPTDQNLYSLHPHVDGPVLIVIVSFFQKINMSPILAPLIEVHLLTLAEQ